MRLPLWLTSRLWLLVPVLAWSLVLWQTHARSQRITILTERATSSVDVPDLAPESSTGFANDVRRLTSPIATAESVEWIAQTQHALATGAWRLRHVTYDNAPDGRTTHAAAPYRWWLAAMATLHRWFSDLPAGAAVERAATFADPALQGLLLLTCTAFVAWRWGALPAAIVALSIVALFPFADGFVAGVPQHHGLSRTCALWSVLLLAPVFVPRSALLDQATRPRTWFALAGVVGGLGLWIHAPSQLPILIGIVLGAIGAAWMARRDATSNAARELPWRTWAISGAVTALLAYALEYLPSHVSWRLEVNHPVYAIAWLGCGELLARLTPWIQTDVRPQGARAMSALAGAVIAVALVPAATIALDAGSFLARDPSAGRLTVLSADAAPSVWAWISHHGGGGALGAALLPLALVVPAGWFLFVSRTETRDRAALVFAFGPLLVAAVVATWFLRMWGIVDAALIALATVVSAKLARPDHGAVQRYVWCGFVILALAPGLKQMLSPNSGAALDEPLAPAENLQLAHRDLAHWLNQRVGDKPVVLLASPYTTTALGFYGGFRGVPSLAWENRDGEAAAIRIAGATSAEEAQALIQRRTITHLVLPSWDPVLDDYARLARRVAPAAKVPEDSFIAALHYWSLPAWLQPVPYHLPAGLGLEREHVVVLEVTDNTDPVLAVSRVAEYFIEMNQPELALAAARDLEKYPGDIGAMTALAFVKVGLRDTAGHAAVFKELVTLVESGADGFLSWDRLVNLAGVLAHGKRLDLARQRLDRCLAEMDENGLRSLSGDSLLRLHRLCKHFGVEIPDPNLRALALRLLPPARRRTL